MTNPLAHRDPSTLVSADINDRRRLAVTEAIMLHEDGVHLTPINLGQVILHHALFLEDGEISDVDVVRLGDKVTRRLFA